MADYLIVRALRYFLRKKHSCLIRLFPMRQQRKTRDQHRGAGADAHGCARLPCPEAARLVWRRSR